MAGETSEPKFFLIKVTKVPDGSAPLEIRKGWVGKGLIAVEKPNNVIERDPLGPEDIVGRQAYMVEFDTAIEMIHAQGGEETATWFLKKWPRIETGRGLSFLTFGAHEVKVIGEINPN